MLPQDERPLWQSNYKAMSHDRLKHELQSISDKPHHYDDALLRKAFIATELALKAPAPGA